MKKLLLLLPLLFSFFCLFSQQEKYSRIKIFTDDAGLRKLAQSGVTIDHGSYRKGVFFESDFSETELQKIKSSGLNYEIKIEDVVEFYQSQNNQSQTKNPITKTANPPVRQAGCQPPPTDYQTPANFSLGAMGGYFTYNEFLTHIDSMAAKFPTLISAKQPIDTFHSIEGRDIFRLKISDNPNTDEGEPQVLYTALHHAREPASLSQLIFYMWYLLENYGTNPEVKYLVDNTEMYFVPMVNPDGYIYNQTTNPGGQGMWRKNRRNNGNGTFGVDLNRNYGFYWGYDNTGSSPDPSSDTYRGTSGFSEPETQALKFLCESHDFKLVLNYHTYGDLFIYPWGYEENIYTPDSAYFANYAIHATRDNHFNFGTGNQTVGYITNGDSDDWMYGEQSTKNKSFSVTPEAGPGDLGFWPASAKIIDLCIANMTQNLTMAHFALKYATVKEESPMYVSNSDGFFSFKIQNLGLDTPANFTVSIIPVGNEITNVGSGINFSNLSILEEKTDSISYILDSAILGGTEFRFVISVDNGLYVSSDTITKIFGQPALAFADNANNMNNWNSTAWGVNNSVYYSPSSSIADSPSGNYSNYSTTSITLKNPVDLTNASDAILSFWARWEIEPGYDYVQILASSNNGATWTPLCGKHTKPGNSNQEEGEPLYDGMQQSWVLEEISLNDFLGDSIKIKFQLKSDGWLNFDGFYFDDLKIEQIITPADTTTDTTAIATNNLYPEKFYVTHFPNPARDMIYFNYTIPENGTLKIYNSLGKIISKSQISNLNPIAIGSQTSLDISKFPSGIYFYQIISENFSSEVKRMAVVK